METNPLSKYWNAAFDDLGTRISPSVFEQLRARYNEPHRHYHNEHHLIECFESYEVLFETEFASPGEVALAIFYHDAIYEIPGTDNEYRSAELARKELSQLGITTHSITAISSMIDASMHRSGHAPKTGDERYFLDIDMSILGAQHHRFDEYERQIRAEYSIYPDDQFNAGRAKVLKTFLDMESIFYTDYFRSKLERQARDNISRSLSKLMSGV